MNNLSPISPPQTGDTSGISAGTFIAAYIVSGLSALYMQLFHGLGEMGFYCVRRNIHVYADFRVGPSSCGKHGRGKLSCAKIIRYLMPGFGIMDLSPSGRKFIGDGNDPFKSSGHFCLITASNIPPSKP